MMKMFIKHFSSAFTSPVLYRAHNSLLFFQYLFFICGELMKNYKLLVLLSVLFLFPFSSFGQDINVHNFIGKKQSDVIKKYGKPVHQDNSNAEMLCMFYKTDSNSMIFVSNKDGVFQAEASVSYTNEKTARKDVSALISKSISNGFAVDTVSIFDFKLHKTGVNVQLQMSDNKITNKFDVRVKANKTES